MLMTLRGYQQLDFSNQSGENIRGVNLFLSFPDEGVQGERVEKLFVRAGTPIPEQIKIGDQLDIAFNHKGKITAIAKK